MTIYLPELNRNTLAFPSPFEALKDPNGLLALGGDLKEERLIAAYNQGIFPWFSPEEPILWWSPSPRAVFIPDNFSPSKSLKKFFRKSNYRVSINLCTQRVIDLCGTVRDKQEMWLSPDMRKAYGKLADKGHCHSVEVWEEETLIGGLYGVQVGTIFCGESMFSLKTNASKIALWFFCDHFHRAGGKLIDCQVINPHTESLGAIELLRSDFIQKLILFRDDAVSPQCYQPQWLSSPSLEVS